MRLEPDEDDPGIKLIRRLQQGYENSDWLDTFSRLPAAWAQVAGWRVSALTGGAEVVYVDGRAWSKYDEPGTPGRIVAYTESLLVAADISGEPNYHLSGVTINVRARSDLRTVSIPESSAFDQTPGAEWPQTAEIVASYGADEVTLPMGRNPSKSQLRALAAFMPSLLADIGRSERG